MNFETDCNPQHGEESMSQAKPKLPAPRPEARRVFFCDRAVKLADEAAHETNATRRKQLEQPAVQAWHLARRRTEAVANEET